MSNGTNSSIAALQGLIKHVVFIIKENHTFDNYFGTYTSKSATVEGDPGIPVYPAAQTMPGPINAIGHQKWLERATGAVRMQFNRDHIPAYWSYADEFTLCDNFFTAVAGPSWPNHFAYMAADSPIVDNQSLTKPFHEAPFDLDSLPIKLSQKKPAPGQKPLTWKVYYGEGGYLLPYPIFSWITQLAQVQDDPRQKEQKMAVPSQFAVDCANQALPNVTWLYGSGEVSEHPPINFPGQAAGATAANQGPSTPGGGAAPMVQSKGGDVKLGSEWTAQQVTALLKAKDETGIPYWESTVIFVSWDDWGGWYDHMSPEWEETWINPYHAQPAFINTQFRHGSRVPCLVLSPFAKAGHISHKFHTQISLVKFCVELFGLAPFSTKAYTDADNMADCFTASNHLPMPTYSSTLPIFPSPMSFPSLADMIDNE